MTPQEYIEETEEEFKKKFPRIFIEEWYDHEPSYTSCEEDIQSFLESRQLGLLELIKGLVPPNRKYRRSSCKDWYEKNTILDSEDGFNSCRSQFLKKIV